MSNYLQTRLEKDKDPIYLHEVGDWCTLSMNNNRGAAIRLRIMFKSIVKDIFDQDVDQMRPEYREMSLYRIAQILRAMPANRTASKLLDFGTRILKEPEEPKPIISLYRILEHISSNTMIVNWSGNTQKTLI